MQVQETYAGRSETVILEAHVAVMVLANEDCTDVELVSLKPRYDESAFEELRGRWGGRGLRSIGVLGMKGTAPLFAFKVPVGPDKVNALASAFIVWVDRLLFETFTEQMTVAELHRLTTLPDNRLPN
jgi:hypothetical protein